MQRKQYLSLFALLLAGLPALAADAAAQDVKHYVPRIEQGKNPELRGPEIAQGQESTATLVGSLKSVVIIGRPEMVKKDGTSGSGVVVRDGSVIVPEAVSAVAAGYLGKPVSLRSIGDLTRDMVVAYRAADLPVVNIAAPEQNISNGVLQLIVVVARLGEPKVEGNRYHPASHYLDNLSVQPGEIIDGSQILEDLRYLNRNPFRRVDAIYAPGKKFGTSDITLAPLEYRPFTVYAGVNNDGNEVLGEERIYLGGMVNNLFGLDETLGYQLTTLPEFKNLFAHVFTGQIPLPGRSELQFVGAFVTSDATIDANIKSGGESKQFATYYMTQLPRFAGIAHDVTIGGEWKSTNNNLEFGGTTVTDSSADIYQLALGWNGETTTLLGQTRLAARLYISPGDIGGSMNSDAAFNALRAGASADYVYAKFNVDHRIDLPEGWMALYSLAGQISNANLLASEALTFGGPGAVRGFETNIARADDGVITSLTLYTPGIQILGSVPMTDYLADAAPRYDGRSGPVVETAHDLLRLFAFVDYGWGQNHAPLPGEVKIQMASIGLGLNYELGRNFSAEIAYGWQVLEEGLAGTSADRDDGFLHFRATTRY